MSNSMSESHDNSDQKKDLKINSRVWWNSRRGKYNKGLLIAGILAFILYVILGNKLIAPYDETFEITFFSATLQIVAYLFMMLIANILYELGSFIDIQVNKNKEEKVRQQLFVLGYWFSVLLPFLIPLKLFFIYYNYYSG